MGVRNTEQQSEYAIDRITYVALDTLATSSDIQPSVSHKLEKAKVIIQPQARAE